MKGEFKFDTEEGQACFRFDMVAGVKLEELEGKNISQVLKELEETATEAKKGNVNLRLSLMFNMLYAAATSYAEMNDEEKPKKGLVSEWLRYIDATDLYKMIFEGVQMFVPKNLPAPKKGAVKQASTIGAE